MPRHCSYCGEPLDQHELRAPDARTVLAARALSGQHPAQARAAMVGGELGRVPLAAGKRRRRDDHPMRICPVVRVERTRADGTVYVAHVPRRRASRLELELAERRGSPT